MSAQSETPDAGASPPPQAKVAELRTQLVSTLTELAQGRESWALLDFPHHNNIGDSAIWLGARMLLPPLHGRSASYVSNARFDPGEVRRHLAQDGIIYLQGGGNFGDLWPGHQLYREAVLARYPGHRIVQLPQSIHYNDPAAIERTKRAIAGHGDFHLLVRDRRSHDFATAHFDCNVLMAPDNAFGIDMGAFARSGPASGIRCIFREDQEKRDDAVAGAEVFAGLAVEDWRQMGAGHRRLSRNVMRVVRREPPVPGWMALRAAAFDWMARSLVAMGFAQLSRAEVVVTDRLHGHIMCELFGVPHVVIDNSYGKVSGYIDFWGASSATRTAPDYPTARRMAEALLAAPKRPAETV